MRHIKIVNNLKMHPQKGLVSKDKSGHLVRVHYRQGGLDGACAAYSVVMNLLILRKISGDDISVSNTIDKRPRMGKLLADLLENRGLVREGFSFRTLASVIRRNLKDDLIVKHKMKSDDTIEHIKNTIEEDRPIVISVVFPNCCAHALLAIGMEYDEKDVPCRLLCLDPDAPSPTYAEWNSYIDISSNIECHGYLSGDKKHNVTLDDILLMSEKE